MPKAHVPAQRAQARGRPAPHALRTYAWRHAVDSMEVWRRCGIAWRCGKGGGMEGHLAALQPFCAPTHSTMCRTQRPARGSSDKNFRLCPSTDGRPYLLGFEKFLSGVTGRGWKEARDGLVASLRLRSHVSGEVQKSMTSTKQKTMPSTKVQPPADCERPTDRSGDRPVRGGSLVLEKLPVE